MTMNFASIWRISRVIRPTPNIVPSPCPKHQPIISFIWVDTVVRQVSMVNYEYFHNFSSYHHEEIINPHEIPMLGLIQLSTKFHVICHEWPPKEISQGGTRLLCGTGDKFRFLLKFRIWGPIKPLVNFYRCFIFYAAKNLESLDLKYRKYTLYNEMMAFLVTM